MMGQAAVLEALAPVLFAGDEDGDAVDEADARFQGLLDVPLGRHLATDGQVVDNHLGARVAKHLHDVYGRAGGLLDHLGEVLAQAVVGHAAHHGHAEVGHVAELHGVVRLDEYGLGEVFADLVLVNIEGGGELDVADMVAAQSGVHQAGPPL